MIGILETLALTFFVLATMVLGWLLCLIMWTYPKPEDFNKYGTITMEKYNPDTDKIIWVIGSSDNMPPRDVIENWTNNLDKEWGVAVLPDVFKLIILRGEKKNAKSKKGK